MVPLAVEVTAKLGGCGEDCEREDMGVVIVGDGDDGIRPFINDNYQLDIDAYFEQSVN